MTLTATAPAVDPKTELAELTLELRQLKSRVAGARETLAARERKRTAISEQIALGKAKPEEANDIERDIEQSQASVSGFEAIITSKNARVAELAPIVRRIDAGKRHAVLLEEVAELKKQGTAAAEKVNAALLNLVTVLLPEFDRVRDALASKSYGDVGGSNEAGHLIRMIVQNDVLAIEAALKAAGSRRRSDLQLTVHNRFPPKR